MLYLGFIVAAAVSIYLYWYTQPEIRKSYRFLLASLRFIALAIIMLLLFNPVLRYSRQISQKPKQLLLFDNSLSMDETGLNGTKKQNFELLAEQTQDILLQKGYDAEIINFADGIQGSPNSTSLQKTLAQINENYANLQEVFLFSDGWFDDNDPGFFNNLQYPVNACFTEFKSNNSDLEISSLKYNQRAWRQETNPFIVEVASSGYKGKAELQFFLDDNKIDSKIINFASDNFQQVLFEHQFEDTGLKKLHFAINADSLAEIQTENNVFPGAILVLENKSSLVIISDKLSWDGRFLVQSVRRQHRFESVYLHKDSQLKLDRQTVYLASQIQNCRVLCLINYGQLFFNNSEAELIKRFVNGGGGLLCLGLPVKSLDELMPVSQSSIKKEFSGSMTLTELSSSYQSLAVINKHLSEIPPLKFHYTRAKPAAQILAQFNVEQNPPAVTYQDMGNGKVIFCSFTGLWKWQLWGNDDHYHQFTSNIMQWLSYGRTKNFYAYSSQNSYLLGEKVDITLNAFDEKFAPLKNLQAEISLKKNNSDFKIDFMLSKEDLYQYSFTASEPGDYDFVIKAASTGQQTKGSFVINEANSELRDKGINTTLLRFLASSTNGKIISNIQTLNSFPLAQEFIQKKYYEIPLYKKWYIISFFLIAFCLEIFLRKRWGLL